MKNRLVIDKYGIKYYYKDNLLHKEDGPAMEFANGDKCWYQNGLLHRENGPAVIWATGYKAWYKHGKRHREVGPAIEDNNGMYLMWWLDDKFINCKSNEEFLKIVKYKWLL
jgi:hypothetical protein